MQGIFFYVPIWKKHGFCISGKSGKNRVYPCQNPKKCPFRVSDVAVFHTHSEMAISTPVRRFTKTNKHFIGLYISFFCFIGFSAHPKHPFRVRPLLSQKCISGRISGKLRHFFSFFQGLTAHRTCMLQLVRILTVIFFTGERGWKNTRSWLN